MLVHITITVMETNFKKRVGSNPTLLTKELSVIRAISVAKVYLHAFTDSNNGCSWKKLVNYTIVDLP